MRLDLAGTPDGVGHRPRLAGEQVVEMPLDPTQKLLIGDGSELDQRFAKLRLFYAKGMPLADWRRYDRIDLRFAEQVVCTKRTTP